jgi:hypothetical protein
MAPETKKHEPAILDESNIVRYQRIKKKGMVKERW